MRTLSLSGCTAGEAIVESNSCSVTLEFILEDVVSMGMVVFSSISFVESSKEDGSLTVGFCV